MVREGGVGAIPVPAAEEWKDVDGFDDYQVSSLGKVQNVATGTFLKVSKVGSIYLFADSYEKYTKMVSRLVAEAFLDDYSEAYEVHHHSTDILDNRVENIFMSKHKVRGKSRKK
jgi:hypothetical protein